MPRPFISPNAIKRFDGTNSPSENRHWWKEFEYLCLAGSWTDWEKCKYLSMYLRGTAEAWFHQIPPADRKSWPKLASSFRLEFCAGRDSELERYINLTRNKDESVRSYFWRINTAARKARISLSEGKSLDEHINRFLRTANDTTLFKTLAGQIFFSIDQVERVLKVYEKRMAHKVPRVEKPASFPTWKPKPALKSVEKSDSQPQAPVYWTYDSDLEDPRRVGLDKAGRLVHFESEDESDDESTSGYTYQVTPDPERQPGSGRREGPDQGRQPGSWRREGNHAFPPRRREAGQPEASTSQKYQRYPPGSPRPRAEECFECGKTGHWANECPDRVLCPLCRRRGHTEGDCPLKCQLCTKVHPRGECELVKAWQDLKIWYSSRDDEASSIKGLPASVLHQLN
jgi:hypothetical protein